VPAGATVEEGVVLRSAHLRIAVAIAAIGPAAALNIVGPAVNAQNKPPIRPNQVFGAEVNGKSGKSGRVTIVMDCPGPLKKGQTGHPTSDQTVGVFLSASVAGTGTGNTGPHGHQIDAFFNVPPPAPVTGTSATAEGGPVVFHHYRSKPIPTSEVLPCSGKGNVYFLPIPLGPDGGTDVVVPVIYISPIVDPPPPPAPVR
jgi:hypothetical protein